MNNMENQIEKISTKEFIRRMKIKQTKLFNKFAKSQGYSDWTCYSQIELGIDNKKK